MPTLPELLPDQNVMLAMTPAELGLHLMRVVEPMRNNGRFHPSMILERTLLYGRGIPTGRPVYPGGREQEVDRAVREGLQWLDHEGYSVAADANGWAMFTRKGEEFLHPPGPPPAGPDDTSFAAGRPAGGFNAPARSSFFNSGAFNTSAFISQPSTSAFHSDRVPGPPEISPELASAVEEAAGAIGMLDSNGNLMLDSNGNLILDPPSGPPPEIPEPGPALIEPEWVEGRLRLSKRLPTNDLWDDAVVSLLAAVKVGFEGFIDALAESGTNFHPAARQAIEALPELLTGVPDQVRIFQMGHAVERLEALQTVADEELPDALRVQYRTLVSQFRRLVERFPVWRALTTAAEAQPLTLEQAQAAVPAARELAAALATEGASEVADPEIASELSKLADAAETAAGAERTLLDFDLVASVNKIMTVLMQPVVYCWNEAGDAAWDELKKIPREFGAGTVKWGKRVVVGLAALHFGGAPLAVFAAHLAAIYPALHWLPAVAAFLKFIAGLPTG